MRSLSFTGIISECERGISIFAESFHESAYKTKSKPREYAKAQKPTLYSISIVKPKIEFRVRVLSILTK